MVLAIALAGCRGASLQPRPSVSTITLSHGLAANYSPLAPTEHFGANEAFYLAVLLTGLRPGTVVSARWLYGDNLIKRTDYVAQQTGNGYVGFELTNDRPPWRAGAYRVEVLVDHEAAGSAAFSVP